EHAVTAPDSNRKIIQEIAKYAYQHEQESGRFPKTLIFAVNDLPHTSHADQLVRICRDVLIRVMTLCRRLPATQMSIARSSAFASFAIARSRGLLSPLICFPPASTSRGWISSCHPCC